ncbi:hypothetical protein [Nonomuraea jabiensis]|uniref:hypothetical protein n=1 Tax=Nonomuraea jabiensis TaxID=882448 RepID=UPI003D720313
MRQSNPAATGVDRGSERTGTGGYVSVTAQGDPGQRLDGATLTGAGQADAYHAPKL